MLIRRDPSQLLAFRVVVGDQRAPAAQRLVQCMHVRFLGVHLSVETRQVPLALAPRDVICDSFKPSSEYARNNEP